MATHSSTLALKIPWMEELGAGCCPWGRKESGTTERLHFTSQRSGRLQLGGLARSQGAGPLFRGEKNEV